MPSSQNDQSYDIYDAYNTTSSSYNSSIGGLKDVGLGSMLGLRHSNMLDIAINTDTFGNSRIIYPQCNGASGIIDWPVQSDVYGTIGNKPAPLTITVSKTLIEDQHQTVHVPRIVIDTAKKLVSIPRTVLEKKSRIIQEPRTIYEEQNEEYKVPRTVIEQEIRVIQVPRTVYDEQTITVNVPKTIYESHSRVITVPKTIIHEREEFYEIPRQVVENKEVNYEIARTVYDTKTSVIQVIIKINTFTIPDMFIRKRISVLCIRKRLTSLDFLSTSQVPRTVTETKIIEAKPVTYHVTQYEYPNLNKSGNFNSTNRGYATDRCSSIISDPLIQLGPGNYRDLNSSRGLERLFPDAKKTPHDPIIGMSKYDHSHHNPYGLCGNARDSSSTWPRTGTVHAAGSNSYRASSLNIEGKPYSSPSSSSSSCGPYPSFQQQQPCYLTASLPLPGTGTGADNGNNLDLNDAGSVFPSFNHHVQPKAVLFNRTKQEA